MSAPARHRHTKEVRGFHKIRWSKNSSRILNLIVLTNAARSAASKAISEGEAPEACEPLFHSNRLNYAVLLKHNVRPHERELFSRDVFVATKIFVPFDPDRLEVGGRSFFVEEDLFKDLLKDIVHIDAGAADARGQKDIRMLEVLSQSPTLDPFIITERLRAEGIAISPAFFCDSYALTLKASSDVFQIFNPLVQKALGKAASASEMSRFVDQVWNINRASTSNPFLDALRIPRSEWPNVIFAWKALIYYDITTRESPQRLQKVLDVLRDLEPKRRVSMAVAHEITGLKNKFAKNLVELHRGSSGVIRATLQSLIAAVLNEANVSAISASLQAMAHNITAVGTSVVLFEQVTSYFLFLFPKGSVQMEPEEMIEQLTNLCEISNLQHHED